MNTIETIFRICELSGSLIFTAWSGYMTFLCVKQPNLFLAGCFLAMFIISAIWMKSTINQIRRAAK